MSEQQRAVRSFDAPTRAEAEAMAAPVVAAFQAAGWTEEERLWIPGDRRVGLGESLLLGPEEQVLLESEGTLRIAWTTEDPLAVTPSTVAPTRVPDEWERLGGTRYRHLVPRWIAGVAVFVVGLVLIAAFVGSAHDRMPPGPLAPGRFPTFSGFPAAPDGTCPAYGLEVEGTDRVCWPDDYVRFFDRSPSPAGSSVAT